MLVLVIEDDTLYRHLTARAIEGFGHSVLTAADGPAGIELARSRRPDVLVIDMHLPSMDGWLVANEVRRLLPRARIIGVSAFVPGKQVQALTSACDAFVAKPYDLDELRRAIAT